MTYIQINNQQYPATVVGQTNDRSWGGRMSKAITLEMWYETALATFVDDVAWDIVYQDEEDNPTVYDNSEYSVAGPITDNRDGTVTVKMGKKTAGDILTELEAAYDED